MDADTRRNDVYDIICREMIGPDPIKYFMQDILDDKDNVVGKIKSVASVKFDKNGKTIGLAVDFKDNKDGSLKQKWIAYDDSGKAIGYIDENGKAVTFNGDKIGEIKRGEEVLIEPPHKRYIAGALFPQDLTWKEAEASNEEDGADCNDNYNDECPEIEEQKIKAVKVKDTNEIAEELIDLSNAFKPSAMSLTFALAEGVDVVKYSAEAAYYTKRNDDIHRVLYERNPKEYNGEINLPITDNIISFQWLIEKALKLSIVYRYNDKNSKINVYTATLENTQESTGDHYSNSEEYFFQVKFVLRQDKGFASLPDNKRININDEDFQSNQLLYRNIRNFATGHGCAGDWDDGEVVKEIRTSIFPKYDMKPILPTKFEGVDLDMYAMSDANNDFSVVKRNISKLCEQYELWIKEKNEEISYLEDKYYAAAKRHTASCSDCLERMKKGLELLDNNESVRKAFMYMNRAILLQQLHYNIPKGEYIENSGIITLVKNYKIDISDKTTWPDLKYGKWRPFQIAFILINLKSMLDETCSERDIVDLIWFPTGGGKTEAYLGLSAYTIFLRRLKNNEDAGTSIIMRYTLRLLTAQQYERASAMICACDIIRKEKEDELGKKRITIGLWVGDNTSYNKMSDAIADIKKIHGRNQDKHRFLILKCPWCGAPMGKNNQHDIRKPVMGYEILGRGPEAKAIFQCANTKCEFSTEHYHLPMTVVDEEIYANPPTLLLGTVDKFAMLPFKPKARSIFGLGTDFSPPDLIIQDELHLISGPLGSMVGCYETMINELCTKRDDNGKVLFKPKIIASTATISRAKEQCKALYNSKSYCVKQFPPSGLDAKDSFFAQEGGQATGRLYVGIFAPAASSSATANIRLFAALLYAAKDLKYSQDKIDPYWTNMGYFNNLKDLGQAVTWLDGDINEYLHVMYKRRYEDMKEGYKDNRRYIYRYEELTSRISDEDIPVVMGDLALKCNEKGCIDVCLATNMISVGLDISRLGLMSVIGQPKTTAEYIQASSRVGRDAVNAPGIVFALYNSGKPRDKSYYEHFKEYHSKIYSHVEPTSVTPFSAPLRKRAIHAILIGLARLKSDDYNDTTEGLSIAEKMRDLILSRVEDIEGEEYADTLARLDLIISNWDKTDVSRYDNNFQSTSDRTLLIPFGNERCKDFEDDVLPIFTPTSMRNVDAACCLKVVDYPND